MAHNPNWPLTYEALPAKLATWATQYTFGDNDSFNGTLEQYKPANVAVVGNALQLQATNTGGGNVGAGTYTSGMIASWNQAIGNVQFRYGYVEASIQLPAGTGLWPAFWLLYKYIPLSNEVDIFEFGGSQPTIMHPGLYYTDALNNKYSAAPPVVAGPDASAAFHKYAVEWMPDHITYFWDDVPIYTNTTVADIPTQIMYILMNLAVGGFFDGAPNGGTVFPANYQIQYLRIWQPSGLAGVSMATITTTNAQNLCDSIAYHIIELVAAVNASTISTLTAAQATTLGRVAALNDASQETFLLDPMNASMSNEAALMNQYQNYNAILDAFFPYCAGIDLATGGLAAFLTANTLQVDPHFLDAFNRAFARRAVNPTAALSAFLAFGSVVANMSQILLTGAGAGTYTAGSNVPAAYGNAPLSIVNIGAGNTGAAAGTYTVTYNKYNAAGVLLTGQTATATMPAGSVPGATVALSGAAAGIAVTGISVTGGTAADKIAVASSLLRTVAA